MILNRVLDGMTSRKWMEEEQGRNMMAWVSREEEGIEWCGSGKWAEGDGV